MDGCSISQAAEHTGFSPSALRFYEQAGLVRPSRTPSGYRCYDDVQLEVLRFIRRAKGFGLSLDEITELLALLDDARCEPVQSRLRDLIDTKVAGGRRQMDELAAFTSELQVVSAPLSLHTPDGPCDEQCGCRSDAPGSTTISLSTKVDRSASPDPIMCTLTSARMQNRLGEWHRLMSQAERVREIDAGIEAVFPGTVDVAAIARLAAAEQDCCSFFTFEITIRRGAVILAISAPAAARPMVEQLIVTAA